MRVGVARRRHRVSLETVSVSLPFGIGSMSWKVDTTQKKAAWSLYVELVTRIAVQPLEVDQGLVREAMNSLYSLFGTTREVLKVAGPDVGASRDSVGGIALAQPAAGIAVLNNGLRPFLAKLVRILFICATIAYLTCKVTTASDCRNHSASRVSWEYQFPSHTN
jgi:hypothetical protein